MLFMESPEPSSYQLLVNIAEICHQHGMRAVVLSPGSRSAPLAITFWRHVGFECHVVPDERSAAYKALGIATATGTVVGLICTSGTAPLNYAPAMAEAYWQGVPLVAFTADRPPEWIGQGENQTIHQQQLYQPNSKAFYQLSPSRTEEDARDAYQQVNKALITASTIEQGPVQVNVPLREPLYPHGDLPVASAELQVYHNARSLAGLTSATQTKLTQTLKNTTRIVVLVGMGSPSEEELRALRDFVVRSRAVLVTDLLANAQQLPDAITAADLIAKAEKDKPSSSLKPDLLITLGGPVLSKALKQFFRHHKPSEHWHISEAGEARDTFQALTQVIPVHPCTFLRDLGGKLWPKPENEFCQAWQNLEKETRGAVAHLATDKGLFSEIRALKMVFQHMPQQGVLHLGNSLPVRHAQLLSPLLQGSALNVRANRGTSGIDGCLSTAVGYATQTDLPVYAILGDVAFLYDRNALWASELPENLVVIIINNSGGGVFRTLTGAQDQPELEPYFASAHQMNFYHTAKQHNCYYGYADTWSSLTEQLHDLSSNRGGPLILELDFKEQSNFQDQAAIHADLKARLLQVDQPKPT